MRRKFLFTLALALSLALASTLALAVTPPKGDALPQEVASALAKEKPLSQADIDTYVKLLPEMGAVAADPAALAKLYAGAGLNEIRFTYISSKVGLSMALAAGATAEQLNLNQIPEVLRPTDEEIELVKKNLTELQKATMEMATNMQQKTQ